MGRWCHPTISSSVVPFSSRPQSFPASGSFKWVSSSHQVSFFEIASKYCISDSLVDYDGKRARRGGRVCPGRGSFKKKVPEVGKTQGVFFSRQRHLKLEKTRRKMTNIKKKGSTRVLVQFSHSVMSDSWQPHGLQHTRPPCPSPNPSAFSNSCPSRQWCHPTISSSFVPFCSCLQSFPASGSFPMSWFFTSGGQSIGVSASASVIPMNIQDWFPLGEAGWIPLQSKGLSRVFFNTTVQKHQFFRAQLSLVQLSHPYMTTGKTIALTRQDFVGKVMSLLFNMLSRLVIGFLPRSKRLLISWLQSPSAVILEPQKIKSGTVSTVSPSICHEVMGPDVPRS